MEVYVTFRHMEPSDAIRAYAEEKTERLTKYLFEPAEVHWVLGIEKIRHIAGVTIVENGVTLKAEEATENMYSAIDMVLDKLEKQVRRYKERLKDHKPHEEPAKVMYAGTVMEEAEEAEEAEGAPSPPRIVKRESKVLEAMSAEEAAARIASLSADFLLFKDSGTGNVSLVYRARGGGYGLVTARRK